MLQFNKSKASDFLNYKHIELQLVLLLKEQRNQRLDLANINALVKQLLVDKKLKQQALEYYSEDDDNIVATSPQTELEDK